MNEEPVRIAMWSGPRNISTAMMRSFEARGDAAVIDEPFYAAYLHRTGLDHPMREAVIASQSTDPREVEAMLVGAVPGGKPVWYQKHMTLHMLPGFGIGWMARVRNAFLIRHPREVLASRMRHSRITKRCDPINTTGFSWTIPSVERVVTNQPRTIGVDIRYNF
jgi:Sulfotransferase domain